MVYIPFSSLAYIFAGTACLAYSFHYHKIWKKTGNIYSKMFWELGLWIAFAEYLYGFPLLIYPEPHYIKSILWFLASFAVFTGIARGPLQIALISWGYENAAKIARFIVPLGIGFLSLINFLYYRPSSYTDNYGIIHWDINHPFDLLWFTAGILVTFIPAIFLFLSKAESKKAIVKKALFSITFLFGGLGGLGTVIFKDQLLLAVSFMIFFLGYVALAAMVVMDITMKEA